MEEHALVVRFDYIGDSLDPLYEIEDQLQSAIEEAGAGEFDGHEIAVNLADGSLYMYGPDAEALFEHARPVLSGAACFKNVKATLRFGPPADGVLQRVVSLD